MDPLELATKDSKSHLEIRYTQFSVLKLQVILLVPSDQTNGIAMGALRVKNLALPIGTLFDILINAKQFC